jgi:hypothetical protein
VRHGYAVAVLLRGEGDPVAAARKELVLRANVEGNSSESQDRCDALPPLRPAFFFWAVDLSGR